jgi:uncharacterized RDD family membrane protein YckC
MNNPDVDNLLDDLQEPNPAPNLFLPLAPFWKRVVAAIIDNITALILVFVWLIGVGTLAGLLSVLFVGDGNVSPLGEFLGLCFWMSGIFFVPSYYFVSCESSPEQSTVGKEIMNLKVVNMEGNRLSVKQAIGRSLVRWASTLFCLMGYLPALFTPKNQTFHDLLAETLVIEKITQPQDNEYA